MGLHVMQGSRWGHGPQHPHSNFTLPAPLAFFGMAVALMFGTTLGLLFGKKGSMMAGRGSAWQWKAMHHHHGWGMPGCQEKHEGRHPGPAARKEEERDEGE